MWHCPQNTGLKYFKGISMKHSADKSMSLSAIHFMFLDINPFHVS